MTGVNVAVRAVGVALVFILVIVGMIVNLRLEGRGKELLREHLDKVGVVTTARVTARATTTEHLVMHDGDATMERRELPVMLWVDAPVSAEVQLGTDGYAGFQEGDRVRVVYDPATVGDPAITVLLEEQVELGLAEAEAAHLKKYPKADPEVRPVPGYEWALLVVALIAVGVTSAFWDRRSD
ncbi:hypothetical protein [Myceligenerans crystallogenes]|uniref:DUF3592 domain-containing protein n=1 Tax=Myceligenerans crystallogenes TaxID=316335 RepID=A0ABN2NEX6_9MICO